MNAIPTVCFILTLVSLLTIHLARVILCETEEGGIPWIIMGISGTIAVLSIALTLRFFK